MKFIDEKANQPSEFRFRAPRYTSIAGVGLEDMPLVGLIFVCVFLAACDSTQRNYAKFELPNGDLIIIDRVEDHWDVPIAQHYYRVQSKHHNSTPKVRETIHSSLNDKKPVFNIIGPGSDSVVAVVSTDYPTNAALIYDFQDGTCIPYKYFPDDVPSRSDDPRFAPLEAAHATKVSGLLARLAKATGITLVFVDGYSGKEIKAQSGRRD